jgi:hypothetical protein
LIQIYSDPELFAAKLEKAQAGGNQ